MYSIIVPVYKNEENLPSLLAALNAIGESISPLEVVFVVDGSPDNSYSILDDKLDGCHFHSQLILLSKNFGSFAAIKTGLAHAEGEYFSVMAADLQEPPELVIEFFRVLKTEPVDITIGTRESRDDPLLTRLGANMFWSVYRKFVQREVPPGGVDIFGCNKKVRDHLIAFTESNSFLVGQLLWLGFRRELVYYTRLRRLHGKSAWTLRKKLHYLMDGIFSFSDMPIKLLVAFGLLGMFAAVFLSALILAAKFSGVIAVPGYTATVLVIVFFAGLNSLGLGIIGSYTWRVFENTKARPHAIVMQKKRFGTTQ